MIILPENRSTASHSLSRRDALRLFGLAGSAALLTPRLLQAAEPVTVKLPAPSLAGTQPGFYRFRIGSLEALALNDGGFAPAIAESPFGIGEPHAKVSAVLHDAFLATDRVQLPFNVLLVRMDSELIMIDTGCGTLFGPAGGRLVANLAAAGIKPEQITGIILTHAHADHFGGLLDATTKEPVFKNAKLFISRKEHAFWTGASPDLSAQPLPEETRKSSIAGAQSCLEALKGRWQFIAHGEKLLEGLEIIDAPGHTPGHVALLFSSGSEQLLHFADAAHNHAISFAHPEWTMAFDTQPPIAIATRKKLFDRAAADRVRVFGGHMPFPSLGHLRATDGHYEYVIEPSALA
jgi:glyoxylase-like metal-dependent hydrolase (beta-lactamase superfamily II)